MSKTIYIIAELDGDGALMLSPALEMEGSLPGNLMDTLPKHRRSEFTDQKLQCSGNFAMSYFCTYLGWIRERHTARIT